MSDNAPHTIPQRLELAEGVEIQLEAPTEAKKARRFKMTAYTGTAVDTWAGKVILDLAGAQLGAKRKPILRDHDRGQIVGYSDDVSIEDGRVIMGGHVSQRTEAGKEVAGLSDEGFPWQASVGFKVERVEEIKQGDAKKVNGQDFVGPGYVITKWKLQESSFVPFGADPQTSGTVLGAHKGTDLAVVEVELQESTTMSKETKTVDPVTAFAEDHAEAVDKWKADAMGDGVKQERVRFAALRTEFPTRASFVCDQFAKGNDVPTAKAAYAGVVEVELADERKKSAKLQTKIDSLSEGHEGVGHGESKDKKKEIDRMELSAEDRAKHDWACDFEGCKAAYTDNYEGFLKYTIEEQRHMDLVKK